MSKHPEPEPGDRSEGRSSRSQFGERALLLRNDAEGLERLLDQMFGVSRLPDGVRGRVLAEVQALLVERSDGRNVSSLYEECGWRVQIGWRQAHVDDPEQFPSSALGHIPPDFEARVLGLRDRPFELSRYLATVFDGLLGRMADNVAADALDGLLRVALEQDMAKPWQLLEGCLAAVSSALPRGARVKYVHERVAAVRARTQP